MQKEMTGNSIMKRRSAVALLLFSFPFHQGNAQQIVVPVQIQIPLLLKVISLEKNISSRAVKYSIGIIFQQSSQASREVKDELIAMNGKKESFLLNGTRVNFIPLEVESEKDIARILNSQRVDALYIPPLTSMNIKMLTEATKSNRVLSVTGVPEYVERGVSVGIGIEGEKPEVIINVTASKEEGVEFSSKVLKMARIVY